MLLHQHIYLSWIRDRSKGNWLGLLREHVKIIAFLTGASAKDEEVGRSRSLIIVFHFEAIIIVIRRNATSSCSLYTGGFGHATTGKALPQKCRFLQEI